MIPGGTFNPPLITSLTTIKSKVVTHPQDLKVDQLVSISQYERGTRLGPPLAVGRMVVDSTALELDGAKGKAVKIIHTFKDKLWEMGDKSDPPELEESEEKTESVTSPPPESLIDEENIGNEIPETVSTESTTTSGNITPEGTSSSKSPPTLPKPNSQHFYNHDH